MTKVAKNNNINWGKDGSYRYWNKFQTMGIDDVGRVTVWHMPWSDLKVQIRAYRHNLDGVIDVEVMKRAQHINAYVNWLKKAVFKDEYDFKKELAVFNLPYEVEPAKDGKPAQLRVAPMVIKAGIERAKHMLLISFEDMGVPHDIVPAEELTLRNLDRFAEMMIRGGRMAQEVTIDAAKTAEPPTIFLKEGMKAGKLMSRQAWDPKKPFDMKFDFSKEDFVVNANPTTSQKKVSRKKDPETGKWEEKATYHFADIFDEMRTKAAADATDGWKDLILSVNPEIPQDYMVKASEIIASHQGLPEIISVAMKLYRTLENTRKAMAKTANGVRDEAYKKAVEDTVRAKFKKSFSAISNMMRGALKDLTPEEAVYVVLATTMATMGKNAKRPSTFVSTALEEEFTLFICSLLDEEPMAREKLINAAGLEDGTEVEFRDGHQVDGRAFTNASLPDGIYTVKVEGKNVYACRKVADVVRARIPEEIPSEIVFQTTSFKTKEQAKAFDERIRRGKKVTLIPHNKDLGLSDAVVVDGVVAGYFDNKVTPSVYLMSHKALPGNVKAGQKAMVSPAVNSFYEYSQGAWLCSEINEILDDSGNVSCYNVFVALKDVSKTFAVNFRKEYPAITVAPEAEKQAPQKKPVGTSNRAEVLFAQPKARGFGASKRDPFGKPAVQPAKREIVPPPTDADAVFGQFSGMSCEF